MTPVELYIDSLQNTHQQHIIFHIHHLFMTYSGVTNKIRFKIPFYDGNKWICYLNPIKRNGVEVCFLRGFELSDRNYLEAKKRTMVKGISIYKIDEDTLSLIAEVFEEALNLDYQNKS